MKNVSNDPAAAAEEQAALWAARLEGGFLDARARTALDEWLAANPGHRALLSAYCQFSADLEEQLPALVGTGAVALPVPTGAIRLRAGWRWLAAVTTMAAAAVLTFVLWPARTAVDFEDFSAPAGQRQVFTLADGTHVELNAATKLQFANQGAQRSARLLFGEAFFVVAKDPARPFTVETPTGAVRVTGTTFDVRTDPTALNVTVIEGSVQVLPGASGGVKSTVPVLLEAGDSLSARPEGISVQKLTGAALEDFLAWRQGFAVFDDVLVGEAVARFAYYHGRAVSVAPELAARRISGRFNLEDLDGFLASLVELMGGRTTHEGGTLHLSRRATPP